MKGGSALGPKSTKEGEGAESGAKAPNGEGADAGEGADTKGEGGEGSTGGEGEDPSEEELPALASFCSTHACAALSQLSCTRKRMPPLPTMLYA